MNMVSCARSVPSEPVLRPISNAAVLNDLVSGILRGLRGNWVWQGAVSFSTPFFSIFDLV